MDLIGVVKGRRGVDFEWCGDGEEGMVWTEQCDVYSLDLPHHPSSPFFSTPHRHVSVTMVQGVHALMV